MIRNGIRRAFQLALPRGNRWKQETDDEIATHIAFRAEQLMACGVENDEAFRQARARFGDPVEARQRLHEAARRRDNHADRAESLETLRQDLSFAMRSLRHNRGWAAVTLLTLALGIGATTAVFSVVSTLLIHPLPYPEANRVVLVSQQPTERSNTGVNVSISPSPDVISAWKANAHTFESLIGYEISTRALQTPAGVRRVTVAEVEPAFFAFAGQRPILGSLFTDADVRSGVLAAVLDETDWRTHFGGDSGILGRSIQLGDSVYRVLGILPSTARPPVVQPYQPYVWIPMDVRGLRGDEHSARLIGRLRKGVSADVASAELDSIFARMPGMGGKLPFQAQIVTPDRTVEFRDSLLMLTWAVGFVLLIAFANVAHLVVARATARQRELAIRAALGAGRHRIFRQLLTESLLLASAGGALGVALGAATLRILIAISPGGLSQLEAARLDSTTLWLTIGITVAGGIAFAVAGSFQAGRSSTSDALKRASANGTARPRGRAMLVVSEMAASTAMVVCAMMVIRSVQKLQHADLGYAPHGLYAVTPVPPAGHATPEATAQLARVLFDRVRHAKGFENAAITSDPPGSWSFTIGRLEVDGETPPPAGTTSFVGVNHVETGYFRTMGMRLTAGRIFGDTTPFSGEVIINRGFARAHWGEESPVGKRIRVAGSAKEPWLTIVGVVADAATAGPSADTKAPLFFRSISGETPAMIVRPNVKGDPIPQIRAIAHSINPELSARVIDVGVDADTYVAAPRFIMLLLSIFAVLALALAGIGLYGVMAYSVAQRTREIGIRVALGASLGAIARGVILSGVGLAMGGVAIGLVGASWGSKVVESQLYGITRSDIPSFALAVSVLVLSAILACIVPTRKAVSVDPVRAIRSE